MPSNDTTASPPQHVGSTAELGEMPEQHDIPPDIAKVLADNLWDLYAEDGDDSTSPNTEAKGPRSGPT